MARADPFPNYFPQVFDTTLPFISGSKIIQLHLCAIQHPGKAEQHSSLQTLKHFINRAG